MTRLSKSRRRLLLSEKDPECDLDYTLGQAKDREITVAASTNLGFGGHDACVVFKKI